MILGPLTQLWDRIYPYTNFTHRVIENPDVLSQLQAGQMVLDVNGNPYLLSRAGEVLEQVKESVMSAGLGMGDLWFDLVCFVLLLSASQAIEFRVNASTGGLDILAKIINKFMHFDIGMSVSIGGALICCTAFFINDFRMVVIGLIGTWLNGIVINYFTASLEPKTINLGAVASSDKGLDIIITDICHQRSKLLLCQQRLDLLRLLSRITTFYYIQGATTN